MTDTIEKITPAMIRGKRAELAVSQTEVAKHSGVNAATISMCEKDDSVRPKSARGITQENFLKIWEALNTIDQLKKTEPPVVRFGNLNAVREMRKKIKEMSDALTDHDIVKLYDFGVYLSAEKRSL
jgi:DNA-binding XRE family transcriptional regulator